MNWEVFLLHAGGITNFSFCACYGYFFILLLSALSDGFLPCVHKSVLSQSQGALSADVHSSLSIQLFPFLYCVLTNSSCHDIPKFLILSLQLTETVRLHLVSLATLWLMRIFTVRNFPDCRNSESHLICFFFLKTSCPALPIVQFYVFLLIWYEEIKL